MTTAYPLAWPQGWARTPAAERKHGSSVFSRAYPAGAWSFAEARDRLQDEMAKHDRNGGVVSTNFEVGRNGPMEGRSRRPTDEGIAIYLERDGKPYVVACDRFHDAEGNMRSLCLALEALRQLERHGGGVMFERAFQGFSALPPPDGYHEAQARPPRPWRDVLDFNADFGTVRFGISPDEAAAVARQRYRDRAKLVADDHEKLLELNLARDAAVKEILGR